MLKLWVNSLMWKIQYRKAWKITLVILICILCGHIYTRNYILPNTYIGGVNVGGKTNRYINSLVNSPSSKIVKIQIKNRIYTLTYENLGIQLDVSNLFKSLWTKNRTWFPKNIIWFAFSLFNKNIIYPDLVFTPRFYQLTQSMIFNFSDNSDQFTVNNDTKKIEYKLENDRFTLDNKNLAELITTKFGTNGILEPKLIKIHNETKEKLNSLNQNIAQIFATPLEIIISDLSLNQIKKIRLTPEELKNIVNILYIHESLNPEFSIDDDKFKSTLTTRSVINDLVNKGRTVSLNRIKNDVLGAMTNRYNGLNADSIDAFIDSESNTDGTKASKYIEIDISKQKMYLFQNGKLTKSYRISTGLYYPTPTGDFKILNKSIDAYSAIYNVWMPYWMAFGYSYDLNAFFGIHELPYFLSRDGTKIQRPRERIGQPFTGGCVALDIGESKEVYDWANVGDPVYIFE